MFHIIVEECKILSYFRSCGDVKKETCHQEWIPQSQSFLTWPICAFSTKGEIVSHGTNIPFSPARPGFALLFGCGLALGFAFSVQECCVIHSAVSLSHISTFPFMPFQTTQWPSSKWLPPPSVFVIVSVIFSFPILFLVLSPITFCSYTNVTLSSWIVFYLSFIFSPSSCYTLPVLFVFQLHFLPALSLPSLSFHSEGQGKPHRLSFHDWQEKCIWEEEVRKYCCCPLTSFQEISFFLIIFPQSIWLLRIPRGSVIEGKWGKAQHVATQGVCAGRTEAGWTGCVSGECFFSSFCILKTISKK